MTHLRFRNIILAAVVSLLSTATVQCMDVMDIEKTDAVSKEVSVFDSLPGDVWHKINIFMKFNAEKQLYADIYMPPANPLTLQHNDNAHQNPAILALWFKERLFPEKIKTKIQLWCEITNYNKAHLSIVKEWNLPLSVEFEGWPTYDFDRKPRYPNHETIISVHSRISSLKSPPLKYYPTSMLSDDILSKLLSINYMNLSENRLTAKSVIPLCRFLKVNKSLKTLNLTKNQINDEGADLLVGALKLNTTLEVLDLSFNPIREYGKLELIETVTTRNLTLKKLFLPRFIPPIQLYSGPDSDQKIEDQLAYHILENNRIMAESKGRIIFQ